MRHAMGIDLDLCVGCMACVSACKQQWGSGPGAARDWVHAVESGVRGRDLALTFYPGLCMQCEKNPCTADCPTGATFVDAGTGVVVVDPEVCIGCGNCMASCPYGARRVDDEKQVVEKCNLCAPYVARGEQPACVATCPAECRIFGDLDDPGSAVARFARDRAARPLETAQVQVGPKTLYAGDAHRQRILEAGHVRPSERGWLTQAWGVTGPLARGVVPVAAAGAVVGGLVVNLRARADRVRGEEGEQGQPVAAPPGQSLPRSQEETRSILRHRRGIRLLHWFNALSWVLLLVTGTALMATAAFALFGTGLPRVVAGLLGGPGPLIRLHALWGIGWAAVIVPVFLVLKESPRHVLEEIRFTRDDLGWMLVKPLALAGLTRRELPPQDKYNAGQKLFAMVVLAGTALIIASGLVMTFHLGGAGLVAAAIMVHKLAIVAMLLGLGVHVTMAAIIASERPALRSMVTGHIDYHHARHHSPKWVDRLEGGGSRGDEGRDEGDGR